MEPVATFQRRKCQERRPGEAPRSKFAKIVVKLPCGTSAPRALLALEAFAFGQRGARRQPAAQAGRASALGEVGLAVRPWKTDKYEKFVAAIDPCWEYFL